MKTMEEVLVGRLPYLKWLLTPSSQHGMAVLAWQQHVKDERNWEGALVAAKREKECEATYASRPTCSFANLHAYSILERLIEMGYSEDDFPENS